MEEGNKNTEKQKGKRTNENRNNREWKNLVNNERNAYRMKQAKAE
jgi:hypothetical protein